MPKWMTVVFALFLSLQVFSTEARNVDDVINNYIEAMGGKDRLSSIHSVYMEGACRLRNGQTAGFSIYKVKGKLFRAQISSGPRNALFIFNDEEGWKRDRSNKLPSDSLPVEVVDILQTEADDASFLVDYALKGHQAELVGRENLDGRDCYKVKLTLNSGQEIDYYIDASTWFINRKSGTVVFPANTQNAGIKLHFTKQDYSNYRQTNGGYIFPYSVTPGAIGTSVEFKKIEVNKPVNYKLYKP